MRVPGQMFRRLIPALGVTGVIVLAALAPLPSLASSTNNCGVKGYGYHDHGKVCPNRPFPGHGKGALAILSGAAPANAMTLKVHANSSIQNGSFKTDLTASTEGGSSKLTKSSS